MANIRNKSAQEEIYSIFMGLRNEQRNLVNNLSTLELDLKEHKWVSSLDTFHATGISCESTEN